MTTELMTTFMATLAGLGLLGVLASYVNETAGAMVRDHGLVLAAAVAVLATLASLYLSGIAGYTPCRYCWWQRIFMYPLAIMLPLAAVRTDAAVRRYALPLVVVGAAISVRQHLAASLPRGRRDVRYFGTVLRQARRGLRLRHDSPNDLCVLRSCRVAAPTLVTF